MYHYRRGLVRQRNSPRETEKNVASMAARNLYTRWSDDQLAPSRKPVCSPGEFARVQ